MTNQFYNMKLILFETWLKGDPTTSPNNYNHKKMTTS